MARKANIHFMDGPESGNVRMGVEIDSDILRVAIHQDSMTTFVPAVGSYVEYKTFEYRLQYVGGYIGDKTYVAYPLRWPDEKWFTQLFHTYTAAQPEYGRNE